MSVIITAFVDDKPQERLEKVPSTEFRPLNDKLVAEYNRMSPRKMKLELSDVLFPDEYGVGIKKDTKGRVTEAHIFRKHSRKGTYKEDSITVGEPLSSAMKIVSDEPVTEV